MRLAGTRFVRPAIQRVRANPVGRPTKSAAESAEKLLIIFWQTRSRKTQTRMDAPSAPQVVQPQPARVVLDTQVVLDWLVFRDPHVAALARAVESGRLRWLASAAMRSELEHVLDRGVGAAWAPDRTAIAAAFERFAVSAELAPTSESTLRCRDPDDQMFIDLALATGARWLFSRDRALLALAPRARALGVAVLEPAAWRPEVAATR